MAGDHRGRMTTAYSRNSSGRAWQSVVDRAPQPRSAPIPAASPRSRYGARRWVVTGQALPIAHDHDPGTSSRNAECRQTTAAQTSQCTPSPVQTSGSSVARSQPPQTGAAETSCRTMAPSNAASPPTADPRTGRQPPRRSRREGQVGGCRSMATIPSPNSTSCGPSPSDRCRTPTSLAIG